jgi:two-component system, response regulator PdtaR
MRRYLLVDDNVPFVENLGEILADAGNEVTIATSGTQALSLLAGDRFDALVTDMRMPVMSGAELIHRVRRLDPELPILIISAHSQQGELDESKTEGVLAVLPKPVPIAELLRILSNAHRTGVIGLVEDDVLLSDDLAELFEARGYASVRAFSAHDVERLHGRSVSVMLVDLMLPDSPRGEVLELIEARFPGVPLLVITGAPELARQLSLTHTVFEKPFDGQALIAKVESLHEARAPR